MTINLKDNIQQLDHFLWSDVKVFLIDHMGTPDANEVHLFLAWLYIVADSKEIESDTYCWFPTRITQAQFDNIPTYDFDRDKLVDAITAFVKQAADLHVYYIYYD